MQEIDGGYKLQLMHIELCNNCFSKNEKEKRKLCKNLDFIRKIKLRSYFFLSVYRLDKGPDGVYAPPFWWSRLIPYWKISVIMI